MVLLYGYLSIAAVFYLASLAEIRRFRARGSAPADPADQAILQLVAVAGALFWFVWLPFLVRVVNRRFHPRQRLARVQGWAWRITHRRTHLAS